MKLKLAYSFFLNAKAGGVWNLIWCFVLIYATMYLYVFPAILFFFGYLADVARALHDDNRLQACPPFEWRRWKQYLKDGLWQLIPLALLISIAVTTFFFVMSAYWRLIQPIVRGMSFSEQSTIRGVAVFMICGLCLAVTIATFFYLWSIVFHIQICGQLRVMPALAFVGQMSRWVGFRIVLLIFLQSLVAIPAILLAYSLVFPIPFVITILLMAQVHLMAQVYRLHLERGGRPIEVHSVASDDDE
ncbi:MAG: hypothetical protein ACRC8S_04560 [Fimbriiglobus sp.]